MMTVCEVERYYGKEEADYIRSKMADGTFKPPAVVMRLKNPKCIKDFLTIMEAAPYFNCQTGRCEFPDHLRSMDIVRIEI